MSALRRHRSSLILLALSTAAVALGCGAAPDAGGDKVTFDACAPLALVVDSSATATQQAGLQAAVEAWNGTAGTQLIAGSPVAGMSAVPIHFEGAAAPDHGLYDAQTAQIYLNDDLTGPALAVVAAHEIGHAMGLVHIDPGSRVSVMNPGNLSAPPTSGDAAQLTALWASCQ